MSGIDVPTQKLNKFFKDYMLNFYPETLVLELVFIRSINRISKKQRLITLRKFCRGKPTLQRLFFILGGKIIITVLFRGF